MAQNSRKTPRIPPDSERGLEEMGEAVAKLIGESRTEIDEAIEEVDGKANAAQSGVESLSRRVEEIAARPTITPLGVAAFVRGLRGSGKP